MGHGTWIDRIKKVAGFSGGKFTTVISSVLRDFTIVCLCIMGHIAWIYSGKKATVFSGGEFTTVILSVFRGFTSVCLYHGPWNLDRQKQEIRFLLR